MGLGLQQGAGAHVTCMPYHHASLCVVQVRSQVGRAASKVRRQIQARKPQVQAAAEAAQQEPQKQKWGLF